ncbi:23S rRNA (adenine(1618)-N(6))-methyltransferase RlmF [Pokkaliibacter sp. CJK22405]|uniref:23S rRNA (adenine(1618)-N(6))-methyltransferase RlmF n=1 Tax=Pokkaliibacter sp. CJK22405 TaxID=3384615 RepID=UPI0039853BB2
MAKDSERPSLHPRNRHQGQYDFARLTQAEPALAQFLVPSAHVADKLTLDFTQPEAVRCLNRALLAAEYGIVDWQLPEDALCPPIPGRADYVHVMADLLAADAGGKLPAGRKIRMLDVGTGASGVYLLLGAAEYGWGGIGADIDQGSLAHLQGILNANPQLAERLELRHQADASAYFTGIIDGKESLDVTFCNPPFHHSEADAMAGSRRKWRQLGKAELGRQLNFGGRANELWCEGGEQAFILGMIADSQRFAQQVLWFSSLVARSNHLPAIEAALKKAGAARVEIIPMAQGNKQSRCVAWSFMNADACKVWRQLRWGLKR